jgi:Ca2+-transporting ATPase
MITGDQAETAVAIARELGLSRRGSVRVLNAPDLAALDGQALRAAVRDVGIFARVPPELKLTVVRALQANGEVVAMIGDGINDGPALRAADVGIAMGVRGTELARELADVVLATDDFAQVVAAVEEGRLVRANVRRVVHFLLATNGSEVLVVLGAVAVGLPSPLAPIQLLWLNLATDLIPGVSLAMEPRDPDVMNQPPRDPREPILPRRMLARMGVESVLMAAGTLATYAAGILRYGIGLQAQSMAFLSLLGAQLLHVPMARAGERPASWRGYHKNRALMLGLAATLALQLAIALPPLRALLLPTPLSPVDVVIAALGALIPPVLIELTRILESRHPGLSSRSPA